MRGKEHLCAVSAYCDGLLLETLTYADEVRSPKPLFGAIGDTPADEDLLAVATQLMERNVVDLMAALKDSLMDTFGSRGAKPEAKVSVHPSVKEALEQPGSASAKRSTRVG